MRIIFLDVDEVLSNKRTWYAHGQVAQPCEDGCRRLDDVAIKMLQHLCIATEAEIVLSSTWRRRISGTDFGEYTGLDCIGHTPILGKRRGEEIQAWLLEHPEVESYVIVDDSCDMLSEQMNNLVRIDPRYGITFEDIEVMHVLLAGKVP